MIFTPNGATALNVIGRPKLVFSTFGNANNATTNEIVQINNILKRFKTFSDAIVTSSSVFVRLNSTIRNDVDDEEV